MSDHKKISVFRNGVFYPIDEPAWCTAWWKEWRDRLDETTYCGIRPNFYAEGNSRAYRVKGHGFIVVVDYDRYGDYMYFIIEGDFEANILNYLERHAAKASMAISLSRIDSKLEKLLDTFIGYARHGKGEHVSIHGHMNKIDADERYDKEKTIKRGDYVLRKEPKPDPQ